MKISNNMPVQNPKQPINFKGKVVDFKPQNRKTTYVKSATDPAYYQALSGIDIPANIKFQDANGNTVEIKTYDAKKYLINEEGKVDPDLVEKFKSLYIKTEQALMAKNQQESAYFESLLPEDPKIIKMRTPKDVLGDIETTLTKISLEAAKEQLEEIPSKSYERTLRLFQLSKTKDGYDFSSLDEKNRLISMVEELKLQYGDNYNIEDLYDEILKFAVKDDGSLDCALADEAVSVINQTEIIFSPKYVINLIKNYIDKDPESREEIIETMKKLNKSDFIIDEDQHDFEDLMDLCFDKNNHFEAERAQTLFKLTAISKNWINAQLDTDYDDFSKIFKNSTKACKNIILDYYKKATDENGNFSPDSLPSPENYFKAKTENLSNIEFI